MSKAAEKAARAHHYRRYRAEGYTAEAALNSARRHIHFMAWLGRTVAEGKRRSRAARKGWQKRRRNA